MKQVSPEQVDRIIRDVAGAEIMPRFRNLPADKVLRKADSSFVTEADREAERALAERFADYLPGCVVVGEESFAENPHILSYFGGEEDVVVIDPIDGTSNFVNGIAEFGVMVALVRRRQTVAAWIHDPNSGDTLMAERGGGVWMRGGRMRLAGIEAGGEPLGIVGSRFRKKMFAAPGIEPVLKNLPRLQSGSAAAFDYGRLFASEEGGAVFADSLAPRASYLLYRQSRPWDHLPGLFLLHEAGGYAATLSRRPYQADKESGLLIAPGKQEWDRFHKVLEPVLGSLQLI